MATETVTDATFETDVLAAPGPVLVDFWAEWCTPCKMIAPSLDEIGQQLAGKLTIVKLNIDDNPSTPMKYGVQAIPTLILFKNGEEAAKKLGALPKGKLLEWIQSAL
jgi:thioredoxin 1